MRHHMDIHFFQIVSNTISFHLNAGSVKNNYEVNYYFESSKITFRYKTYLMFITLYIEYLII